MKRLLLFDIDGTLVDTGGAGRDAVRTALETVYGETGPIDSYDFHGKTDPGIVRGLLSAAGWDDRAVERRLSEFWPLYLRELERELTARDGRARAYPGVRDLLEGLALDARFELALVTGNVAQGAWQKLAAVGLDRHFRYGAFGSDSQFREELPPLALRRAQEHLGRRVVPEEAWIIGDTPEDIRCARSSGIRVLAVATGRHGLTDLREHDPDHALPGLEGTEAVTEVLAS